MALPEPVPGLVVRYSYLWHSEFREGREDGAKDRPCAIVAAMKVDAEGDIRVLVLPVTHSPPSKGTPAVEIPPAIKKQLKLDADRSWIVVSEWNEFVWPGPDLRRGARGDQGSVAYGFLPRGFFATVRDRFIEAVDSGRAERVHRTE
jgi:hypothetical protein